MCRMRSSPTLCPLCRGAIAVVRAQVLDRWPRRGLEEVKLRDVNVAACSGCEFVVELSDPRSIDSAVRQLVVNQ